MKFAKISGIPRASDKPNNERALGTRMGAPQLTESYLDSKKEIDIELRVVCEKFIQHVSDSLISPMSALLSKVNVVIKMAEDEGKDASVFLKQQPFAKPETVRKVVSETYMLIKSKLPSSLQSMSLFLANKDTEYILFKPVKLTACEARKTFKDIIEELKAELGEAIYANGDISNPKQRTLEMYHARIDEQNKEEILSSFSQEDGCIRVLIATIAYGMGIDCKGVKTVIHYGPPRNLEAYLQESGRAGRSSETGCKAIILYSNVMLQHCDSDIVDYVRNDDLCRRKLLLTHFDFKLCELKQYENPHECCDICQKQCHCAGDKCDYVYFNAVGSLQQDTDASRKERSITDEQKTKLTSKLEYLKKSLNNSYTERASNTDLPLFTPVNLLSGFGDSQIVQVVDNARKLFTLKCIYRYVDIWNDDVAVEILFALSSVFADIDFNFEENETEDTDPLPDTGLWDFNDDDDDDYELLAISEFLIAEDMHGSCDYVDDSSL
ncbi:hypothetical protein QZH41_006678 [Actinostola sp. cb2023]|nr:hypothetical protein QZH41_006678 [Actinostola sp. cb2023]